MAVVVLRSEACLLAVAIITGVTLSSLSAAGAPVTSKTPDQVLTVSAASDITWLNMNPPASPGPRMFHALVYDPPTDKYIVFGGFDDVYNMPNSTYAYDLDANSWEETKPTDHPDFCIGPAYAYDSKFNVMLLFGANDEYTIALNETWAYDASANKWTEMTPADAPSPRMYAGAAYDSHRNKMILFGGVKYEGAHVLSRNDTWSYDFSTNCWLELKPANAPSPRWSHSMVYDPDSDRVILFGGHYYPDMSPIELIFNETWAYDFDANEWSILSPTISPPERFGHSSVYDPVSDLMLVFGGSSDEEFLDDMWAYDYDTNGWSEVNQLARPPARSGGAMALDPATGAAVLFGGGGADYKVLGDTWSVQLGPLIPEFPALGLFAAVTALLVMLFTRRRRH